MGQFSMWFFIVQVVLTAGATVATTLGLIPADTRDQVITLVRESIPVPAVFLAWSHIETAKKVDVVLTALAHPDDPTAQAHVRTYANALPTIDPITDATKRHIS
jgi:hypothetical protein